MSLDITTVETAITTALDGPLSVTTDAGTFTQRSLADLIAAHRYLSSLAVAKNPALAMRRARLVPDGTVQDRCGRIPGGFNRL